MPAFHEPDERRVYYRDDDGEDHARKRPGGFTSAVPIVDNDEQFDTLLGINWSELRMAERQRRDPECCMDEWRRAMGVSASQVMPGIIRLLLSAMLRYVICVVTKPELSSSLSLPNAINHHPVPPRW